MLKEYETKFWIGEIVKFYVDDEPYIGEIAEAILDKYNGNQFRYEINSGDHTFVRRENEIEPYETEIDEPYICDNCLLSLILDDVEEGELTANEAREILGLETINEELENYEFKTAGNAYFSIFPDDEHEDAVHIEIDPTWLWINDDIDELISQLNWVKARNSNNDFRVDEKVSYDKVKENKPVLVVTTPTALSDLVSERLSEKVKAVMSLAGIAPEVLVLEDGTKINWL